MFLENTTANVAITGLIGVVLYILLRVYLAIIRPKVSIWIRNLSRTVDMQRDGLALEGMFCTECSYDLRGQHVDSTCTECGTPIRIAIRESNHVVSRRRRTVITLVLALIFLFVSYVQIFSMPLMETYVFRFSGTSFWLPEERLAILGAMSYSDFILVIIFAFGVLLPVWWLVRTGFLRRLYEGRMYVSASVAILLLYASVLSIMFLLCNPFPLEMIVRSSELFNGCYDIDLFRNPQPQPGLLDATHPSAQPQVAALLLALVVVCVSKGRSAGNEEQAHPVSHSE
ncbi:MAG: hypothetical protein O7G85_15310 [Planctomycetota bacterium]|nr:hypothetical protein [Planctomycetota bacterium]